MEADAIIDGDRELRGSEDNKNTPFTCTINRSLVRLSFARFSVKYLGQSSFRLSDPEYTPPSACRAPPGLGQVRGHFHRWGTEVLPIQRLSLFSVWCLGYCRLWCILFVSRSTTGSAVRKPSQLFLFRIII